MLGALPLPLTHSPRPIPALGPDPFLPDSLPPCGNRVKVLVALLRRGSPLAGACVAAPVQAQALLWHRG